MFRIILYIWLAVAPAMVLGQMPDIQGHRGCRGLFPENTLPAFLHALDLGVTTLELDVVISKDSLVVVSHEPWLNSKICRDAKGNDIPHGNEKEYNIFAMDYATIAQCDCGSLGNPNFPAQERVEVPKPLLSAVFEAVKAREQELGIPPVHFNIEIKSKPAHDGTFHPAVETYADLLLAEIVRADVLDRTVIQSFDVRPLQYLHKNSPIELVFLVANTKGIAANLDELGFIPQYYSPYYKMTTSKMVDAAHAKGIKVVPWTVNKPGAMKKMLKRGVDGIITDYPDRIFEIWPEYSTRN